MNTRSIAVANMVFFKHKYLTMPEISKADALVAATQQLAKVLQGELSQNIGKTEVQQLMHLVNILKQTATTATWKWADQTSTTIPAINGQTRIQNTNHIQSSMQENSPNEPTNYG